MSTSMASTLSQQLLTVLFLIVFYPDVVYDFTATKYTYAYINDALNYQSHIDYLLTCYQSVSV